MRALRFVGWWLGAIVVPGLALWRAGRSIAAVLVAGSFVVPTLCAFAALSRPSWGLALFVTGLISGVVTFGAAIWGALGATQAPGRGWPSTIGFVIAVLVVTQPIRLWREHLAEPFKSPSESMAPSLVVGDQFLVRHHFTPRRGAVVVFPVAKYGVSFIKRVVGLPGDAVSWRGATLVINGVPVTTGACEAAAPADCRTEAVDGARWRTLPGKGWLEGDWQVPAGHVFVLGDNRDNSEDSRTFGPVAIDSLTGDASYIHFSWPDTGRSGRSIDPE